MPRCTEGALDRNDAMFSLRQGDVLATVATLPAESAHCVCTSPPYWGLRRYSGEQARVWGGVEGCQHVWGDAVCRKMTGGVGKSSVISGPARAQAASHFVTRSPFCSLCSAWRGGLGEEPTVELYIQHLMQAMAGLWRVLRDDGVCWINLDDTRLGSGSPGGDFRDGKGGDVYLRPYGRSGSTMRHKDMALVPERFVIAAQAQGWIVRSKVVWALPNPMPESARDRPTDSYQVVYMLVKQGHYWWDQEAVREWSLRSVSEGQYEATKQGQTHRTWYARNTTDPLGGKAHLGDIPSVSPPGGRNARNVQRWPTQGLGSFQVGGKSLTHFAAFPQALPNWCIRASCPAECCGSCGAGYRRVAKKASAYEGARLQDGANQGSTRGTAWKHGADTPPQVTTLGWVPSCSCDQATPTVPGIVLDPFIGSGTTALAAQELGRRCWGIDLSQDYVDLAWQRLGGGTTHD